MTNTSTLFINNITQLDFGKLTIDDWNLKPSGETFMVNVQVSGPVEEKENVIVDFSNIKKTIKGFIDDREEGFDHKFIICKKEIPMFNDFIVKDDYVEGVSPNLYFNCPSNAIKFVDDPIDEESIKSELEKYLTEKLTNYYNIPLKIEVFLDDTGQNSFRRNNNGEITHFYFRYMHGLKNSSSWGCQNILHGHSSWLTFCDDQYKAIDIRLDYQLLLLYKQMKNIMFIWQDNIVSKTDDKIELAYTTERGNFELSFNPKMYKHFILEKETTIENLVSWFINDSFFSDEIKILKNKEGVKKVFMSEGLSKGACADI